MNNEAEGYCSELNPFQTKEAEAEARNIVLKAINDLEKVMTPAPGSVSTLIFQHNGKCVLNFSVDRSLHFYDF